MSRSYQFLCPIARSLDRVGDRWTLLILRDLHAGPMRFGDLQGSLPGLASNLLTTRLQKLVDDGLVEHEGPLYTITELGRRTDRVLWELAQLGMQFPPGEDLKKPKNLRLAAITLQSALRKVAPADLRVTVELVLDGEAFTVAAAPGQPITVQYGAPEAPDVVAETAYDPMMAAAAGALPLDRFRAEHVRLDGNPRAVQSFAELMQRVMLEAFRAVPE